MQLMEHAKEHLDEHQPYDDTDALHHIYDRVFDGFSARLTPEQVAYLDSLPGVIGVYPGQLLSPYSTHSFVFRPDGSTPQALIKAMAG